MKDKLIKKFGVGGLVMIGLLFFAAIAVLYFTIGPKALAGTLTAAASLPILFGISATPVDSSLNLRTLNYTHNAALSAGDVIVVNSSVLVAVNDTDADVENVFIYQGKVTMPKTAPLVISVLDAVYYSGTAVNKTSGGNTACGYCVEAAASADTTVTIMLMPNVAVLDLSQSSQNSITDPGNAGAIPVTASGVCELVTAGAETRTLAAPSFLGQTLELCFKTDGGDCVITCATTVNQTGNNTITLNDAGDAVTMIAKRNGANLRWSVLANDGASLTTV